MREEEADAFLAPLEGNRTMFCTIIMQRKTLRSRELVGNFLRPKLAFSKVMVTIE